MVTIEDVTSLLCFHCCVLLLRPMLITSGPQFNLPMVNCNLDQLGTKDHMHAIQG